MSNNDPTKNEIRNAPIPAKSKTDTVSGNTEHRTEHTVQL